MTQQLKNWILFSHCNKNKVQVPPPTSLGNLNGLIDIFRHSIQTRNPYLLVVTVESAFLGSPRERKVSSRN